MYITNLQDANTLDCSGFLLGISHQPLRWWSMFLTTALLRQEVDGAVHGASLKRSLHRRQELGSALM